MTGSPERTNVLVVDDEDEIVSLLRDFLEAEGFSVATSSSGDEALSLMATQPVDCVLLDIMMPGMSGFEVCRKIRENWDIPVLFLTARQDDTDKIRGLGLGADDYIVKAATPGEVIARIRAVLRRYRKGQPPTPARLDFGRLIIDTSAHEVIVDGKTVPFTPKEFELLRFLAEHPRQVFTQEALFDRLWGEFGDRHTVSVHIGRIREKIEADPSHPKYIVTIWGVGYRFEAVPR